MDEIQPHPQHDPAAEQKALFTSKSKGERLFDTITYGAINGVGTFIATIPLAASLKYGKGAGLTKWGTKSLLKTGMPSGIAEEMINTTALMQGGNLAIIPVKMMENYKPQIVDKLNDMLGDKSGKASVQDDHKQSWMSLIKGRAVAWAAVFTGFRATAMIAGAEKIQAFDNKFSEICCKILHKPTHVFGADTKAFTLAQAETKAASLAGTESIAARLANAETKAFRYGKIGAMDVFATAAATVILYVSSRYFAKKNPSWKILDDDSHQQTTGATPTSSPKKTDPEYANQTESRFSDTVIPRNNPAKIQPAQSYENALIQQRLSDEKNAPTLAV